MNKNHPKTSGLALDNLLLTYKYNFSQEDIRRIESFWKKYIDFEEIHSRNFLSSKYALTIGDVASFLIIKFPFIKREFKEKIVGSVKVEKKFNIEENGFSFQYFCYALFKDYGKIIPKNEVKNKSLSSIDFELSVASEVGLEIKIIKNKNRINDRAEIFSNILNDIFANSDFCGKFYVSLTFNTQKINDNLLDKVYQKTSLLINILLEKIKKINLSLLAEDCERDDFNFCLIRVHYQPQKTDFNNYWNGGDLAGNFVDAHGISKGGGGYCLSLNYITIDLKNRIRKWSENKFKNKKGIIFFTALDSVYDDKSIREAFVEVSAKNSNLIALFHFDLWNNDKKLAKLKAYYKSEPRVKTILDQFDKNKVDIEEILCDN